MIYGVDTSFSLRLLTDEPENLAAVALKFLIDCQQAEDRILISDWVVAEAYHALQHHYGASKKASLSASSRVFETPCIASSGSAAEILRQTQLESAKPGFIDRVIHLDYLRDGADLFVTFEKSAKLERVQVPGPVG